MCEKSHWWALPETYIHIILVLFLQAMRSQNKQQSNSDDNEQVFCQDPRQSSCSIERANNLRDLCSNGNCLDYFVYWALFSILFVLQLLSTKQVDNQATTSQSSTSTVDIGLSETSQKPTSYHRSEYNTYWVSNTRYLYRCEEFGFYGHPNLFSSFQDDWLLTLFGVLSEVGPINPLIRFGVSFYQCWEPANSCCLCSPPCRQEFLRSRGLVLCTACQPL